jgi:hypothetical protein
VIRAVALALAVALATGAVAQQPRDRAADAIDFDAGKDQRESDAPLPAAPKPENLIKYDPGRPGTMSYYVDAASITISKDGIVRYTNVARGDGTAQNVTFEGIRCDSREKKIYAYGRADGTWSPLRDPQWSPIRTPNIEGYRHALYQDYFCPSRGLVRSVAEAVDALKRRAHPSAVDFSNVNPVPR